MSVEQCPVCGTSEGQLKRHLVKFHGYRYTQESPNMPVPNNPTEQQAELRALLREHGIVRLGCTEEPECDPIEALAEFFTQELEKREMESTCLTVAGKKVEFSHTAVNGDMHLFINSYHNPDVCPECIQPGLLVAQLKETPHETS